MKRDGQMPAQITRQHAPHMRGVQKSSQIWTDLERIALSGEALKHHRVVTQKASEDATPFDILRTKVLLQMQQNGWKRLAITSPLSGCGKSTMSCNLALGLGRQSGLRSMLIDMDLQDPSVGDLIGYHPKTSMSDLLLGKTPFSEHAVRVGENVAVAASGRAEEDPTRVVLSDQTAETLDAIQDTYDPDIMIFDTPSILLGDNTRAFLKNVDCALIVIRASSTRYGHFDASEREVGEHTNVLGTVLNAFRTKDANFATDI
ncbi:MAG: CpsD/CapB family tyrosine-protein kinase [Pseudomonadota bacterium]